MIQGLQTEIAWTQFVPDKFSFLGLELTTIRRWRQKDTYMMGDKRHSDFTKKIEKWKGWKIQGCKSKDPETEKSIEILMNYE